MYIFLGPQVGKQDLMTICTVLYDPLTEVLDILGNSTTVHRLQLGVKDYSLTCLPPFLTASFDNSQVFLRYVSNCVLHIIFTISVFRKKGGAIISVSYTHLTLPTICSV